MPEYIGAIDQGTTSTRFMVWDRSGRLVTAAQEEHRQIYPKPGWVEHDPNEIWARTQQVIAEAMRQGGLSARDLAAIGITNQRETTVLWSCRTGQPVYNALVWQDTRVDDLVTELARTGGPDRFRPQTGLPLSTYFSSLKIGWVLDHVRHHRHIPDLAPHWRAAGRTARHGFEQRQPHSVDESGDPRLGPGAANLVRHPTADPAADPVKQRNLRDGDAGGGPGCSGVRYPG